MSKKRKLKGGNRKPHGLLSVFDIPIPDSLHVASLVDTTALHKIKAEITDLEDRISRNSRELESQRADIVPSPVFQAIIQIATSAWRARIKMIDYETNEPREDMRRVFRHVDAIYDTLKQIGVEIVDATGKPFDSGMALNVVTFEPTQGLSKEEIKETVKPSIIWQGRLVQKGEVIVGTPSTTV